MTVSVARLQITQCCGCVSLRMGTLIIGLVNLVGSIISLAGLVLSLIHLFGPTDFSFGGISLSFGGDINNKTQEVPHYEREYLIRVIRALPGVILTNKVICITMTALCCMQIIIDILLIVAAAKRMARLALPWLVLNVVCVIFNVASFGAMSIMGFLYMPTTVSIVSIGPIVLSIIYIAVNAYFMVVVSNFYENFKTLF